MTRGCKKNVICHMLLYSSTEEISYLFAYKNINGSWTLSTLVFCPEISPLTKSCLANIISISVSVYKQGKPQSMT